MSGVDYLFRTIAGGVAGAIVYVVLVYMSFSEVTQNVAVGLAVVVFALVAIFGKKMFRFVMELVDTIW